MSFASNLILIVFGINLILFAFGEPEANSPMLAIIKALFAGGEVDWGYLIYSIGSNAWVYGALMAIVAGAAFLTGGTPLTGGGGHGSLVAMQIIAISIFSALFLVPNFGTLGFPSAIAGEMPILEIINMVFGALFVVSLLGILRGIE